MSVVQGPAPNTAAAPTIPSRLVGGERRPAERWAGDLAELIGTSEILRGGAEGLLLRLGRRLDLCLLADIEDACETTAAKQHANNLFARRRSLGMQVLLGHLRLKRRAGQMIDFLALKVFSGS